MQRYLCIGVFQSKIKNRMTKSVDPNETAPYEPSKVNMIKLGPFCITGVCELVPLSSYTLPHDSGRVLWFHVGRPCVCPSVCLYFISG